MSDALATGSNADPFDLGYAAEFPDIRTAAVTRGTVGEVGGDGYDAERLADHPAWRRDAVSISARVRAALSTLKPIVVRVLAFWDHAVRSVRIGGRVVEIDPSGCYRMR